MRPFVLRLTTVLSGVALAVAGCSGDPVRADANALVDSRGVYTLQRIDGNTLPQVFHTEPNGSTTAVVSSEIVLDGAGRATWSSSYLITDAAGGMHTEGSTESLAYRVDGTDIEIGFFTPCPPESLALCRENQTGTVDGNGMVLLARTWSSTGELVRLEFRLAATG